MDSQTRTSSLAPVPRLAQRCRLALLRPPLGPDGSAARLSVETRERSRLDSSVARSAVTGPDRSTHRSTPRFPRFGVPPQAIPTVNHLLIQNKRAVISAPKLLIADPDEVQLDYYQRHFRHGAWSVETATNALDCLARLRDFEPDVLVLEPEMPWGGGSGVLECMRDDPSLPKIPVIVLTRGPSTEELWRITGYSLEDFFVKPVSVETLARRIYTAIGINAETHDEHCTSFARLRRQ